MFVCVWYDFVASRDNPRRDIWWVISGTTQIKCLKKIISTRHFRQRTLRLKWNLMRVVFVYKRTRDCHRSGDNNNKSHSAPYPIHVVPFHYEISLDFHENSLHLIYGICNGSSSLTESTVKRVFFMALLTSERINSLSAKSKWSKYLDRVQHGFEDVTWYGREREYEISIFSCGMQMWQQLQ